MKKVLGLTLVFSMFISIFSKGYDLGGVYEIEAANKKSLSISVFGDLDKIDSLAELFEKAHPDVDITINKSVMRYDSYEEDYEKYKLQTTLKLMSGLADDIIDISSLSRIKLASSGVLAGFYPLMQNDPFFNPDDYYMNLLEAFEFKDELYTFPLDFDYTLFGVNNDISDKLISSFKSNETISIQNMLDLYKAESNKNERFVFKGLDPLRLVMDNLDQFIDYELNKCYFNTEGFIGFIDNAKAFKDDYKGSLNISIGMQNVHTDTESAEMYFYKSISSASAIDSVCYLLPYEEFSQFTEFMPYANNQGKVYVYAWRMLSISDISLNKELAWEFVRFCTTPEANLNIVGRLFSVNRQEFVQKKTNSLKSAVNELEMYGYFLPGDKEQHIKDCVGLLDAYNNMPMASVSIEDFYDIISNEINKYTEGSMSAELTAENLQKKITMALEE